MNRSNCWEHMNCGREFGGRRVGLLGLCPAVTHDESDGVNHGDAGGRFCWTLEGTLCPGEGEDRIRRCFECSFHAEVRGEEGESFVPGVDKPDGLV